jgi:hypothetical protein
MKPDAEVNGKTTVKAVRERATEATIGRNRQPPNEEMARAEVSSYWRGRLLVINDRVGSTSLCKAAYPRLTVTPARLEIYYFNILSPATATSQYGRFRSALLLLLSVGTRRFRIIIELCPFGVYLAILFFLQFHQVIFLPDLDIVAKTSIKILKS